MKIKLQLYASLAKYMPRKSDGKPITIEVSKGTTVAGLLDQLRVPVNVIKMIFLNGVHAKGEELLQEGDRVGVFPPVAGG